MPANRNWKRRVEVKADLASWQRLGKLLDVRRRTLGYTWRTDFERERRVNRRMAADIESAAPGRVNTFTNGSLGLVAQGYAVDYESMLAVLRGEADELVPVPVAPVSPDFVPVAAAEEVPLRPGAASPFGSARTDSDRPWFDEINERRVALAARGITDPDGAQMFPGSPGDAKAWDSIAAYGIPAGDRVWAIADFRRRAAARTPGPDAGTGTNGALCRGKLAGRRLMPRLPLTSVTGYRIQHP
jgi:hypothetical protein